jgi:fibronectin type III domain protein
MGRPARPLVVLAAAVAVVCAAAPTAAAAVPAAALAGAPTAAADPSPSFPGPPVVVDILPTRATLTWQPPNTEPPVTYYRTYRVTMRDGQPWEEFYNASYATSLLLALPTPDTGYTFFVETGDQTSNGLRSPWVTFRTPPAPIESQPPTAPGLPEASAVDPNALTLTWAPSTDNSGVAAYHIYRTRHDGAVQPAGVTVTQTTWSFTRLLPDFDYRYHVVAVDHGGNRSASSPAVTGADPARSAQLMPGRLHRDGPRQRHLHRYPHPAQHRQPRRGVPGAAHPACRPADLDQLEPGVGTSWRRGGLLVRRLGRRPCRPAQSTIRFTGTHTGSNPPPTDVRLNGQPCT